MEAAGTPDYDIYIFVHGPHRRGASQGYQLADIPLHCSKSVIHGKLWQSGTRALLTAGPGSTREAPWVLGDIYRVDEDRLRMLDEFHAIPAGSSAGANVSRLRAEVFPYNGAGAGIMAWIWEWTGPLGDAAAIPSGDWMDIELPRKPPTLTKLALICMIAAPLFIALGALTYSEDLALALAICGLTAPAIAAFANYFGGRRRERWRPLRILHWFLLGFILLIVLFLLTQLY